MKNSSMQSCKTEVVLRWNVWKSIFLARTICEFEGVAWWLIRTSSVKCFPKIKALVLHNLQSISLMIDYYRIFGRISAGFWRIRRETEELLARLQLAIAQCEQYWILESYWILVNVASNYPNIVLMTHCIIRNLFK